MTLSVSTVLIASYGLDLFVFVLRSVWAAASMTGA